MISPVIMGSPARRLTNPITRCRDQPHSAMQGQTTDKGTDQTLDAKRLTLMSACSAGHAITGTTERRQRTDREIENGT